ncbi:MAG TPA: phosphopantetheine-binding protein [Polyangiaceae bacterium]
MQINDAVMSHEVWTDSQSSTAVLTIPAAELARTAHYENVLGRVRSLLIEQLHLRRETDEIDPDAVLFGTGLGLDSVDAVELTIAIETEFGTKVPDSEESRRILRTVNSLVEHILKLKEVAHVS